MMLIADLTLITQSRASTRQALFNRDVSEMIESAKTPADHDAIAAAYDQEAAYNRDQAALHLRIAESYDRKPRWRLDYSKICREMVKDYSDLAKEDAELAQEHRKMAESLQSSSGSLTSQGSVGQGAATTPDHGTVTRAGSNGKAGRAVGEVSLMKKVSKISICIAVISLFALFPSAVPAIPGDRRLTLEQLIAAALEVSPRVRAARERWYSASHQIQQNYVPADPTFGYSNIDSPQFPLFESSQHAIVASQNLQFPGKALVQGTQAKRTADIARLTYEAAIRDLRAQVEVAYYQLALDNALGGTTQALEITLGQVVKVTEIAFEASQASQADFIAAELARRTAEQQLQIYKLNVENDLTQLNTLLYRRPDEPLVVDDKLDLKPIGTRLDNLIDAAEHTRQEILQAALTARNSADAETLARMEYLPDYTLTYEFDDFLLSSAAPAPNRLEDHSLTLAFNVPIYFWWHQREDMKKGLHDLAAAREDLDSLKSETAAAVTTLYRTALLDAQPASVYRDSLIPLALQEYQVALVGYQSGKVNFAQLQNAYQQVYALREAQFQLFNQFLAQRVALEQTVGTPLP